MKKQKKNQITNMQTVSVGILSKRKWNWLFVLAATLIAAVFYTIVTIEYFYFKKCDCCTTYYTYLFHYRALINNLWIVIGGLILLAMLCAVLFIRKRKLILTPSNLIYQKGRRSCVIPFTSIKNIKDNKKGITVRVPGRKFKFVKIKNKREFCIALSTLLKLPLTTVEKTKTTSPVVTEGKIQYFEALLAADLITKEQFNRYVSAALSATSTSFD